MDVFKAIFWVLTAYLASMLLLRLYWLLKDRYFQLSWCGEWILAAIGCVGVFGVAYSVSIASQGFWWVVLAAMLATTIARLNSKDLKEDLSKLTIKQRLLVRGLMVMFTLPLFVGVLFNAANFTGIW